MTQDDTKDSSTDQSGPCVFISYSSKDAKIAKQIVSKLEALGVPCWIAPRDIQPGKQYNQAILDAIQKCSALLFLMTEHSENSPHVEVELDRAFHYQKTIIPLRLREIQPSKRIEYFIANAQWVDAFSSPLSERLKHVAAVVQAQEMGADAPRIPKERPTFSGSLRRSIELAARNAVSVAAVVLILVGVGTYFAVRSATHGVTTGMHQANQQLGTISKEVSGLKKETSSNPRKELVNLGYNWSAKGFQEALSSGDLHALDLYKKGGFDFTQDSSAEPSVASAIAAYIHSDSPDAPKVIAHLLSDGAIKPNQKFKDTLAPWFQGLSGPGYVVNQGHTSGQYSLLTIAINGNAPAVVSYLVSHAGINPNIAHDSAGAPLVFAAKSSWVKPETVKTLVRAGADPGTHNYSAYRALLGVVYGICPLGGLNGQPSRAILFDHICQPTRDKEVAGILSPASSAQRKRLREAGIQSAIRKLSNGHEQEADRCVNNLRRHVSFAEAKSASASAQAAEQVTLQILRKSQQTGHESQTARQEVTFYQVVGGYANMRMQNVYGPDPKFTHQLYTSLMIDSCMRAIAMGSAMHMR